MDWIQLTNEHQLEDLRKVSSQQPQLIFKHSTRCAVSTLAKNRLERSKIPTNLHFHFLDLIKYRAISNKIEEQFGVSHESPQVLLIRNGVCIYDESHSGISMEEIEEQANQ